VKHTLIPALRTTLVSQKPVKKFCELPLEDATVALLKQGPNTDPELAEEMLKVLQTIPSNEFRNIRLLVCILDLIVSKDDLRLAELGSQVLRLHPSFILFNEEAIRQTKDRLQRFSSESTIRYRLLELLVQSCCTSNVGNEEKAKASEMPETNCCWDVLVKAGVLSALIEDFGKSDDPLIQTNSLHLMSDLCRLEAGRKFLLFGAGSSVLSEAMTVLKQGPDAPFSIVRDACLKLFTVLGSFSQDPVNEVFKVFPDFKSILLKSLRDGELAALEAAAELVRQDPIQRLPIILDDEALKSLRAGVGTLVSSGDVYCTVRALKACDVLLDIQPVNSAAADLSERVFWSMSLPLAQLCLRPFTEIQVVAFEVLEKIVRFRYGVTFLMRGSSHDLLLSLLDRSKAPSKEAKEVRWKVVNSLLTAHPEQRGVPEIDSDIWLKLKNFQMQGPFHVEAYSQVLMEDSTS
ncbi:unnamed protein product, partial [Cyprideis torosa]